MHELQHAWSRCQGATTPYYPPNNWLGVSCAKCLCAEMNAYYCSADPECMAGDLRRCARRALASCVGAGNPCGTDGAGLAGALRNVPTLCPNWGDRSSCWWR
jgi:hypothetical protein